MALHGNVIRHAMTTFDFLQCCQKQRGPCTMAACQKSISTWYCRAAVFPLLVQCVKSLCRQKHRVDRKLTQKTTNNCSFLSI